MEIDENYNDVPSNQVAILRRLINSTIEKFYRCSFDTYDQLMFSGVLKINRNDFFQLCSGPFVIETKSDIIVFSSDESINSIIVFYEKIDGEENKEYSIFEDEDYTCYASNQIEDDLINTRLIALIGTRIQKIEILKRNPKSAKHESLPNEVGILFTFENEEKLVLSHNLFNSTDSFSVIFYEQISKEIEEELRVIEVK